MLTIRDRKDPRAKKGNDQRIPLLAVSGYDTMALIEERRTVRGNEDERIFRQAPDFCFRIEAIFRVQIRCRGFSKRGEKRRALAY